MVLKITKLDSALLDILKSEDLKFLEAVNRRVVDRIRDLRDVEALKKKAQFTVGDKVEFDSSKRGRTIEGTVEKICSKNIVVREANGFMRWRVHPSFLRKVF